MLGRFPIRPVQPSSPVRVSKHKTQFWTIIAVQYSIRYLFTSPLINWIPADSTCLAFDTTQAWTQLVYPSRQSISINFHELKWGYHTYRSHFHIHSSVIKNWIMQLDKQTNAPKGFMPVYANELIKLRTQVMVHRINQIVSKQIFFPSTWQSNIKKDQQKAPQKQLHKSLWQLWGKLHNWSCYEPSYHHM